MTQTRAKMGMQQLAYEDETFDKYDIVVKDGVAIVEKHWLNIEEGRGPYPDDGRLELTKEESDRIVAVLKEARTRAESEMLDRTIEATRATLASLEAMKAGETRDAVL